MRGRSRESRAWIYDVPGISAADAEGGSSQPAREPPSHPRVYIATSLADFTLDSLAARARPSRGKCCHQTFMSLSCCAADGA